MHICSGTVKVILLNLRISLAAIWNYHQGHEGRLGTTIKNHTPRSLLSDGIHSHGARSEMAMKTWAYTLLGLGAAAYKLEPNTHHIKLIWS